MIPCESCVSRKQHSLFNRLSPREICILDPYRKTLSYQKGEIVFSEGDEVKGAYCIFSGCVKIYKTSEEGEQHILRVASSGNLIGYSDFFLKKQSSTSAAVLSDTTLCLIQGDGIEKLLKKSPHLNRLFLRDLSKELINTQEKIQSFLGKNAEERLRDYLSQLLQNHKKGDLQMVLSREELASFLGVRSETVIRIFSNWEKKGWISLRGKRLTLHRPSLTPL